MQLREKQKAKRVYGILEKQFNKYFKTAESTKGVTGHILLQMLERRLDSVVFRLCLASSRSHARQIVRHNHAYINDKKVNIPSFLVKEGDIVEIKGKDGFVKRIADLRKELKDKAVPKWLDGQKDALKGVVKALPAKEDIDLSIQEQLIVELYSK